MIFDEAQRAWNLRQTANFMRRKKNQPGFSESEPEFLISCMDRHTEWAVIVCLVGGGQEIHTGEAGIDAWLEAVNSRFPHWHMYISSRLTDSEYAAGKALDAVRQRQNTHFDDCLHLAVSMRSFGLKMFQPSSRLYSIAKSNKHAKLSHNSPIAILSPSPAI